MIKNVSMTLEKKQVATPETTRKQEKMENRRPPVMLPELTNQFNLPGPHIHGKIDDESTPYLALETKNNDSNFYRPKTGDRIYKLFCDCKNPEDKDPDRYCYIMEYDTPPVPTIKTLYPVNQKFLPVEPQDEKEKEFTKGTISYPNILMCIPPTMDRYDLENKAVIRQLHHQIDFRLSPMADLENKMNHNQEDMVEYLSLQPSTTGPGIIFRIKEQLQEKDDKTTALEDLKTYLMARGFNTIKQDDMKTYLDGLKEEWTDDNISDLTGILMEPKWGRTKLKWLTTGDMTDMINEGEVAADITIKGIDKLDHHSLLWLNEDRKRTEGKARGIGFLPSIIFTVLERTILDSPGLEQQLDTQNGFKQKLDLIRQKYLNEQMMRQLTNPDKGTTTGLTKEEVLQETKRKADAEIQAWVDSEDHCGTTITDCSVLASIKTNQIANKHLEKVNEWANHFVVQGHSRRTARKMAKQLHKLDTQINTIGISSDDQTYYRLLRKAIVDNKRTKETLEEEQDNESEFEYAHTYEMPYPNKGKTRESPNHIVPTKDPKQDNNFEKTKKLMETKRAQRKQHMEQNPENLAKTIRAKRLIKKRTGEYSTLSTSEEYRLVHEVYSDSDEEDEQRGDTSLLTAQELRSKRKNSHEKNIRWIKQMEQDDNDIGMSRTPRHLIKILQDHWRDHTSQDNCSRENNREDNSHEQPRKDQDQDQNQNQDNDESNQPTYKSIIKQPTDHSKVRHPTKWPPFDADDWDIPQYFLDIAKKDRHNNVRYKKWNEMMLSRTDIRDVPATFHFIQPHFPKGFNTKVEQVIDKHSLRGLDWVTAETIIWEEAYNTTKKNAPWATSGKEFKPSMDHNPSDWEKIPNGGPAMKQLMDRVPPMFTTNSNEKPLEYHIMRGFQLWRSWCTKNEVPPSAMPIYCYTKRTMGDYLYKAYEEKMSSHPEERMIYEQISTYIEQLMKHLCIQDKTYVQARAEIVAYHADALQGVTRSVETLRLKFENNTQFLLTLNEEYEGAMIKYSGVAPDHIIDSLHTSLRFNLIRDIIEAAGLKGTLMATYSVGTYDGQNWQTKKVNELIEDLHQIIRTERECLRADKYSINKVTGSRTSDLELHSVKTQLEELSAKINETQGKTTSDSEKQVNKFKKEKRKGPKRKHNYEDQDQEEEYSGRGSLREQSERHRKKTTGICENCWKKNKLHKKTNGLFQAMKRTKMICQDKGHCLEHGEVNCTRTKKCKNRHIDHAKQVTQIALENMGATGVTASEARQCVTTGLHCIPKVDAKLGPTQTYHFQHGYHADMCPAAGDMQEPPILSDSEDSINSDDSNGWTSKEESE